MFDDDDTEDEGGTEGPTRLLNTIRAGDLLRDGGYVEAQFDLDRARRVRAYLNDVREWSRTHGGQLRPYEGDFVTDVSGDKIPFETDEATLERLQAAISRRFPETRAAMTFNLGEVVVSEWPLEEVSRIGSYMNATKTFIRTGNEFILAPFRGEGPTDVHGNYYPFEVDENTIYEIHYRDEPQFHEQYENPQSEVR